MIYYVGGLPCSDELYHHGILGQKWGVRRFQNPDGTRTALGKVRYSAGKVVSAIGSTAIKAAKYQRDKYLRKHPWKMTDEELNEQLIRAKKVEELTRLRETVKGRTFAGKMSNLVWKTVGVGTDKFAENLAVTAGKGMAENMLKSSEKRESERLQDKMELMKKQAAMYNKMKENELGTAKKEYKEKMSADRKESVDKLIEKSRNVKVKMLGESSVGSKKALNAYVKEVEDRQRKEEYEREKKNRLTLYGPGGTAYR